MREHQWVLVSPHDILGHGTRLIEGGSSLLWVASPCSVGDVCTCCTNGAAGWSPAAQRAELSQCGAGTPA